MKNIVILQIMLLAFTPLFSFSQTDSSGIYFTSADFVNKKLSLSINCKNEKHKIKADMIFHQKEITIKHHYSVFTYPKDSVYGIKYCDGSIVRIFENAEFPLMNFGESIMVYEVVKGSGMKNDPVVSNYYFSKDAASSIQKLTIYNLKAAFPTNHKFHDLMDMTFRSDDELTRYDSFHKIMKINRVLQNSLETK